MPHIRDAVNAISPDEPVVFELDTVTFIDSAGLSSLLGATQRPAGARLATCSEFVRCTADLFVRE